jgi:tripartite-type tricarboxylate transporter receptor subunit TctC
MLQSGSVLTFTRVIVRRGVLAFGLGCAGLLASAAGLAQTYPAKPVKLIVPFAAGGGSDTVSRIVANQLGERVGQTIVVENRGGAAGNIGMEAGARAAPDGYTLTVVTQNMVTNPHLYKKMSFDPLKDFAPVALMTRFYQILVVHPSVPAKSVAELIALAKAKPGMLTAGTSGVGGTAQMDMDMLASMTGIKVLQVPYKGESQVMTDLLSGQLTLTISSFLGIDQHIRAGKLRGLGVTSAKRSTHFPDVPAIAEAVPGYEMDGWYGIAAPAATPAPIVNLLARETIAVLGAAETRQRIVERGFEIGALGPDAFARVIQSDYRKYGKLIQERGITLEQ